MQAAPGPPLQVCRLHQSTGHSAQSLLRSEASVCRTSARDPTPVPLTPAPSPLSGERPCRPTQDGTCAGSHSLFLWGKRPCTGSPAVRCSPQHRGPGTHLQGRGVARPAQLGAQPDRDTEGAGGAWAAALPSPYRARHRSPSGPPLHGRMSPQPRASPSPSSPAWVGAGRKQMGGALGMGRMGLRPQAAVPGPGGLSARPPPQPTVRGVGPTLPPGPSHAAGHSERGDGSGSATGWGEPLQAVLGRKRPLLQEDAPPPPQELH